MQDQTPYKMTPEQGWKQMQPILDREMPVQKRSRRFLFFWWSAIALLVMGIGGIAVYSYIGNNSTRPSPGTESEMKANIPVNTSSTTEQPIMAQYSGSPSAVNTSTDPGAAHEFPSASNADHSVPKHQTAIPIHKIKLDKKAITPFPEAKVNMVLTDQEQNPNPISTSDAPAVENSISTNGEQVVVAPDKRNGEVTEPVPALDPAYFTIPEDAFQDISSVATNEMIEPLKHRISFHPGVEGSAFSGFQGGVGGYVGVFLESRMSSRFSLMTGLGYRSFSPGATLFNGQKVLTSADAYNGNALLKSDTLFTGIPTYVASETVNSASYHDLDPIIESVDQWQARLGIAWIASKHFYAEGGYGFAFKTQAYSQFPIVAYDYTSSISNIKVSHTFNQYDVIRTTMSSVYLGLGYRIGHHLGLDLKWLHTFQPYVLSNSSTIAAPNADTGGRNDFIRGLSLGANWKM